MCTPLIIKNSKHSLIYLSTISVSSFVTALPKSLTPFLAMWLRLLISCFLIYVSVQLSSL